LPEIKNNKFPQHQKTQKIKLITTFFQTSSYVQHTVSTVTFPQQINCNMAVMTFSKNITSTLAYVSCLIS